MMKVFFELDLHFDSFIFSYSVHCDPLFLSHVFLFQLECPHRKVLTTSNYSSLPLPSDTYFLSTLSVSLSHTQTHTHTGILIHTVLSLSRLVTHTLVFRGYQSAECKLSPPKTVTCRQRCLAPCGNPLNPLAQEQVIISMVKVRSSVT